MNSQGFKTSVAVYAVFTTSSSPSTTLVTHSLSTEVFLIKTALPAHAKPSTSTSIRYYDYTTLMPYAVDPGDTGASTLYPNHSVSTSTSEMIVWLPSVDKARETHLTDSGVSSHSTTSSSSASSHDLDHTGGAPSMGSILSLPSLVRLLILPACIVAFL